MCANEKVFNMISNKNRSLKYIEGQKKKGLKRVSFFTNVEFWKYVKNQALKHDMTISEFLMFSVKFKS